MSIDPRAVSSLLTVAKHFLLEPWKVRRDPKICQSAFIAPCTAGAFTIQCQGRQLSNALMPSHHYQNYKVGPVFQRLAGYISSRSNDQAKWSNNKLNGAAREHEELRAFIPESTWRMIVAI